MLNRCLSKQKPLAFFKCAERKIWSTKKRVVVVGAGWAGYRVARDLNKAKYDVSVVSPRNHFLFTPLLPSTAVGTVEFRAIQEPVRTIPNIHYYQAQVDTIDFAIGSINCTDAFKSDRHKFKLDYDALILAPGSETNTFGVSGVETNENVFFLKQLEHARAIRDNLIACFERASSPGASEEERTRLLTFVVVGGGPTSVEFTAELYDFLKGDVSRLYPDLFPQCKVYLVEASGHILGAFNESLVGYVEKLFQSRHIHLLTNTQVNAVLGHTAILSNHNNLDFGMMIWSTGVKQVPLISLLDPNTVKKSKNGRLEVDANLRVLSATADMNHPVPLRTPKAVFSLGDCAGDYKKPLPALAQVAAQQAIYLAKTLNDHDIDYIWAKGVSHPFQYKHLGSMASVGEWKGVFDSTSLDHTEKDPKSLKGFLAFALWRAAYWTKQVSLANKMLILMYWFKSAVFGRDVSRF